MTLNLYVSEYWVPFPASEYGGMAIFAANSKKEVRKLAKKDTSEHDMRHCTPESFENLDIRFIGTTDEYTEPSIVEMFLT